MMRLHVDILAVKSQMLCMRLRCYADVHAHVLKVESKNICNLLMVIFYILAVVVVVFGYIHRVVPLNKK